jgi:hypothetical protein
MLIGLIMALAAQAAATAPVSEAPAAATSYGPPAPRAANPSTRPAAEPCKGPEAKGDGREIVVCVQRPQGYRIDPDLLAAQRAKRHPGKLRPPEKYVDNSCATIGPMGCRGVAAIDLVTTAVALATMAQKAAKGENVGKMFVTTPSSTEYQLYQQAKRQREEKEMREAAMSAAQGK